MSLSTKEREKHVLECLGQKKSYREIQSLFHISPREISSIVKKAKEKNDKEEEKKLQQTLTSKAYKLFAKGKDPLHVATTLGIEAPEARKEGLALVLWLPSRVRRIYLGSRWDSLAGLMFRFKPAIVSNDGTIR